MKIDFDSKLIDLKGKVLKDTVEGKQVELTLKDPCLNALLANTTKPQNAPIETGRDKFKKYNLAKKINSGGAVELISEDITLIKEQLGLIYPPLLVGICYDLLENPVADNK